MDDIRLQKWQVPDEYTNRDQLEFMLQLIQATLAKGSDKCPITDEEARALVDAIVEKIHRLNY